MFSFSFSLDPKSNKCLGTICMLGCCALVSREKRDTRVSMRGGGKTLEARRSHPQTLHLARSRSLAVTCQCA